jgi:hypothetical protein
MIVPPIEGISPCDPIVTIKTSEMAAAAKMYLELAYGDKLGRETHHRAILSSASDSTCSHGSKRNTNAHDSSWPKSDPSRLEKLRRTRYLLSLSTANQCHSAIQDYTKIRLLGKGSFGTVQLMGRNYEGNSANITSNRIEGAPKNIDIAKYLQQRLYAMKIIRKSDMLNLSQEGHLRAERDCLVASRGGK